MNEYSRHFLSYLLKYNYFVKTYWTKFLQNDEIFHMKSRKRGYPLTLGAQRGQKSFIDNFLTVNILVYITEAEMFNSSIYNYIFWFLRHMLHE